MSAGVVDHSVLQFEPHPAAVRRECSMPLRRRTSTGVCPSTGHRPPSGATHSPSDAAAGDSATCSGCAGMSSSDSGGQQYAKPCSRTPEPSIQVITPSSPMLRSMLATHALANPSLRSGDARAMRTRSPTRNVHVGLPALQRGGQKGRLLGATARFETSCEPNRNASSSIALWSMTMVGERSAGPSGENCSCQSRRCSFIAGLSRFRGWSSAGVAPATCAHPCVASCG